MKMSLLMLLLAGVAAPAVVHAAEAKRPNILVIVADDLGYGELTVQGFTKEIPTPHIDSIAKNGTRFLSGYVSGPYCSPTRAALLTGRYQQRIGHEFNPGRAEGAPTKIGLDVTQKTFGDRFKAAGYATGWIGKSHLGSDPEYHPQKRGFDHYFGFLGGAHSYVDWDGKGASRDPVQRNGTPVATDGYLTDALGREAAEFVGKTKAQPWLMYLAFNAVHSPLDPPEKYTARFASITDPKRRKFAAMLSALDDAVGRVLERLRETDQENDTLIFFISDNGGPTASITSANGPLRGFKAQTWEGGIRVAWMVQWKGHLPAGKVDPRPVIQLDILPTALAAAGIEPQADWKLEGVNLLPYLTGEKTDSPHDALYWRFGQQMAIRKGDWKLVKAPGGGVPAGRAAKGLATTEAAQLYNLANDIGETTNLADKEPGKVQELAAAWNLWNKDNIPPKWIPAPRAPNAAPTTAGNDSAKGPWKSGDTVEKGQAPQVAARAFVISAQVDAAAPKGVIVAQGGGANGYALFVQDGKLALALRANRALTVVTATKPLEAGSHKIGAQIKADGSVTLTMDDQTAAEGKLPALIPTHPGEGLTIGHDGRNAVGPYEAPHAFNGKIEAATVTLR